MRKIIFILTFTILGAFSAIGQINNKSNFQKIKIDVNTVEYIEIRNIKEQLDTLSNKIKHLTNAQINLFVEKYNNSKPNGLRKTIPLYFISVYLNNGTKRVFRINGQYIKENNDYCFDLVDSKFIESFWNELNTDYIKNIRYVFEDYIKYQESTDSQENKDLMSKSLKSITILTNKDELNLLINVWMYYDPTDFSDIPEIYRILKNSKPQSIKAIKTRIKNKKKWETNESAPYSDLINLLKQLEDK